jgi:hypothetical protein
MSNRTWRGKPIKPTGFCSHNDHSQQPQPVRRSRLEKIICALCKKVKKNAG